MKTALGIWGRLNLISISANRIWSMGGKTTLFLLYFEILLCFVLFRGVRNRFKVSFISNIQIGHRHTHTDTGILVI